ncbi:MAG TPA: hypothetical protein VLT45_22250 [Kofleriaceae bacterium]|nr:hypothetical protein [Kofleriaceae bacterium]
MTRCPWFGHDVDPDPATLQLSKGAVGVCLRCNLQYVVVATSPVYQLDRDEDGSALAALALSSRRPRLDYERVLARKGIVSALKRVNIGKKHYGRRSR